jgi:hypothetical protein
VPDLGRVSMITAGWSVLVRTCKISGHKEKGVIGKPGFCVAVYTNGGRYKAGILEDTLMSEKEARERAGCQRESNRVLAASAACTPHIGDKAQGVLRGILHGSKKANPNAWGDVNPDVNPGAKAISETLTGFVGGREGDRPGRGGSSCVILTEKEFMLLRWIT